MQLSYKEVNTFISIIPYGHMSLNSEEEHRMIDSVSFTGRRMDDHEVTGSNGVTQERPIRKLHNNLD